MFSLSDVDECATGVCDQGCENTNGSYRCFCYQGYRLVSKDRCVGESSYWPFFGIVAVRLERGCDWDRWRDMTYCLRKTTWWQNKLLKFRPSNQTLYSYIFTVTLFWSNVKYSRLASYKQVAFPPFITHGGYLGKSWVGKFYAHLLVPNTAFPVWVSRHLVSSNSSWP